MKYFYYFSIAPDMCALQDLTIDTIALITVTPGVDTIQTVHIKVFEYCNLL